MINIASKALVLFREQSAQEEESDDDGISGHLLDIIFQKQIDLRGRGFAPYWPRRGLWRAFQATHKQSFCPRLVWSTFLPPSKHCQSLMDLQFWASFAVSHMTMYMPESLLANTETPTPIRQATKPLLFFAYPLPHLFSHRAQILDIDDYSVEREIRTPKITWLLQDIVARHENLSSFERQCCLRCHHHLIQYKQLCVLTVCWDC